MTTRERALDMYASHRVAGTPDHAAFRVSISRGWWLLRAAAAEELGYFGGRPAT
jgi:hypothetical protein